jgi:PAS domain S-box-containing protein
MGAEREIAGGAGQGMREDPELVRLQDRVAELEETLEAIRTGQVDALVDGTAVYTLESAESASNRFRGQVLQQISETVIAVDNDHLITYINEAAEEQYGRKATEVLGLKVTELYEYRWVHPEDEEEAVTAIRDQGIWRGENIHVKRDGQVLHVESVVKVLHDAEGAAIGLLAVMRDITQRVKDREALAESARQKDRFLATLAHELRNPLSPLMNGLQLLEGAASDQELLEDTRQMMQRQLNQLVRLVDDLMDLSRISRGRLALHKENVDLKEVMRTAIETSRPLIEQRGHRFEAAMDEGSCLVHGDAARLAQIISNLLNNAAKYTEPGGTIELTLVRKDPQACISVKDTGIGIDPEAIGSIFEMFTQVESNVQGAGGLGIGLNIAQRLTHMHQGSLAAQSEGRGKGAEFKLCLPLLPSQTEQRIQRAPSDTFISAPQLRVMVVDDNHDGAFTLMMILRKAGYLVEVAYDGEQALRSGAAFGPDLIFMDIGMPVMDGYAACERMRAEPWGQRARIIAVSGWGQDSDRIRSHQAGFDEHLVKPIERHTILRVVQDVIK